MQQRVHTRKNSTRAVNNELKISAWRHQKKTIRAALKIRIASNIEATHTREKWEFPRHRTHKHKYKI